jgi:hypothetical protein
MKAAAIAILPLITNIDNDDFGKMKDEEAPKMKPKKRKPICKTGFFNFLSSASLIVASMYCYNLYLKH